MHFALAEEKVNITNYEQGNSMAIKWQSPSLFLLNEVLFVFLFFFYLDCLHTVLENAKCLECYMANDENNDNDDVCNNNHSTDKWET